MSRAGSQPVMDEGRTDRMPHLDRKRPGANESPGARGEVTKSLSLYRRKATRAGMTMPKKDGSLDPDFLLGLLGASAVVGLSCEADER